MARTSLESSTIRMVAGMLALLVIDGAARVAKPARHPVHAFGVAEDETAALLQAPHEALEHALLGRPVEVDEDVPAKNKVEGRVDRPAVLDQVDAPEPHEPAKLGANPHEAGLGPATPQEVSPQHRAGNRAHVVEAVDPGGGAAQHLRVDVRGEDAQAPARRLGESVRQRHGDRVGLLAAAAARAPDPDDPLPVTGGPLQRFRRPLLGQIGEVARLAVELRLVRGHRVDEAGELVALGVLLDETAPVVPEAREPEGAQTRPQTHLEQRPLVRSEGDARAGEDQRAECLELRPREIRGDPRKIHDPGMLQGAAGCGLRHSRPRAQAESAARAPAPAVDTSRTAPGRARAMSPGTSRMRLTLPSPRMGAPAAPSTFRKCASRLLITTCCWPRRPSMRRAVRRPSCSTMTTSPSIGSSALAWTPKSRPRRSMGRVSRRTTMTSYAPSSVWTLPGAGLIDSVMPTRGKT